MKNNSKKIKSILAIALGTTMCFASMPVISKHAFLPTYAKESGVAFTPSSKSISNGNFETIGDTLTGWESSRIKSLRDLKTDENKVNSTISGIVNVLDETKYKETFETLLKNNAYLTYNPLGYPAYPNRYDSETEADENTTTSALLINAGKVVDVTKKIYTVHRSGSVTTDTTITIPSSNLPQSGTNYVQTSSTSDIPSGTYTYREDASLGNVWELTKDETTYQITEKDSRYEILDNKVYETYTSSSDIQLAGYCYFKLVFRVCTTDGATASIRLTGDFNDNASASFNNIDTTGSWKEYTYYIATSYGDSGMNKTRIQLALGNSEDSLSSGAVFFDDVDLTEVQYSEFNNAVENESTNVINMRKSLNVLTKFSAGKTMEQEGFTWNSTTSATEDAFTIIREEDKTSYNTFNNSNYCLKATNSTSDDISFKTSKTQVEPFKYYKVSIWSRYDYEDLDMFKNPTSFTHDKFTIALSGTLNGKTVATKSYQIDPYNENQRKTDGNGHISNFWTETSFYVQACPLYATDVWFNISIPKNSTFLFDNYTIEEITSTEYSAMSDRKLALTSTLPNESITNGFFNTIDSEMTSAGLYSPSNWTLTTGGLANDTNYYLVKETTIDGNTTTERSILNEKYLTIENGVKIVDESDSASPITYTYSGSSNTYVNTSSDGTVVSTIHLVKNDELITGVVVGKNYSNTLNSKSITTNDVNFVNPNNTLENYLVINNTNSVIMPQIKYTSDKFSVASGKYKAINVYVYSELTSGSPAKINLLNAANKIIASIDIDAYENVENEDNWQNYTFYVKGGLTAENMYIQVQYGDGKTQMQGALLVKTVFSAPSSETIFKENQKLNSTKIKEKHLKVVSVNGSSFTEIGDVLDSDGKFSANGVTLNSLNNGDCSCYILDSSLEAYADYKYADGISPFVMVLNSTSADTHILEFNQKYTLAKSSFYKLSIIAKAVNLPEGKNATIKFANLDTQLQITSNEYKEYTLYFASNKEAITSNITIALENTIGQIAISNISVEKLTESNYNSGIASISQTTPNITKLDLRNTTTSSDELPDAETNNKQLEILFATLSSLLLVCAIIIALVFTKLSGKRKKTRGQKNKVQSSDADEQKGFV